MTNKLPKAVEADLFPTEPTKESQAIEDFIILLYGPPKIGKSTFVSKFENVCFLETESGLKFLKTMRMKVRSWNDFRSIVLALEKSPKLRKTYRCIAIDTVDNLAKFCSDHVCESKGVEHPSDLEWGKGWEALSNEWGKWIGRLCSLGLGIIFIGHSKEKEVKSRSMMITKTMPSMQTTTYNIINAICDFIFYIGFKEVTTKKKLKNGSIKKTRSVKRLIFTKPTESVDAGDRTANLPAVVPLDFNIFVEEFEKAKNTD